MTYRGNRTTGFPSPSEDSAEGPIDLAETLNLRAPSRYPVRVAGAALAARMIRDGDILIADAALPPAPGRVAVVMVNGEVLVGTLARQAGEWQLLPGAPGAAAMPISDSDSAEIWAVVTALVRTDV